VRALGAIALCVATVVTLVASTGREAAARAEPSRSAYGAQRYLEIAPWAKRRDVRVPASASVVPCAAFAFTGCPARGAGATGKPVHLLVEADGDLLIHSPIYARALALGGGRRYEFRPMLREIGRYVRSADLAICHVETPMGPGPPHGYPLFNTPRGLAPAIEATGWDACSTASNHSLDGGQRAIDATLRTLKAAGIRHAGTFSSRAGQRRTLLMTVKGVRVAFMSYTEMTNGIPLPFSWSVNLASAPRILADARRARRRGAQVVIVNVHWGAEYQSTPSAFQKRLAHALTASPDITAVVGQHVHVVQPIRSVNGKLVVFGEGNLLSNQSSPAASQEGLIALLDIEVQGSHARVTAVRYVPVWVRRSDYVVLPVGAALRRGLADPATLRASYRRTVAVAGRSAKVQPLPRRLEGP
jgi:poly-gamma-glutamate synthesis protein (capsule biosynthesis protein)